MEKHHRLKHLLDTQDATSKECGLHSGNIVTSAAQQGAEEAHKDLWETGPVQRLDHSQLERLADGERDTDTLVVLYAPWCQYSQVRAAFTAVSERLPAFSSLAIGITAQISW